MSKRIAQKRKIQNACCVYDFTLFDEISIKEVRNTIGNMCKKYCFQLEKGGITGKNHYQGRLSLKLKKRLGELIKILREIGWKHFDLSITSNENKKNNFYVMKEDTRLEGPFTEENDIYIPEDIREIVNLYPWQSKLRETLKVLDRRTVDVVVQPKGNIGKTTFVRYMMIYENCKVLPFCNDYKDIMRMAMDIGPKKIYLVDMPRSLNKDKLFQFFGGIETLKSGYAYDDRYKFQDRLFDRPRICIFTNEMPDKSLLSEDMWRIWKIEDGELLPYEEDMSVSITELELQEATEFSEEKPVIHFDTYENEKKCLKIAKQVLDTEPNDTTSESIPLAVLGPKAISIKKIWGHY